MVVCLKNYGYFCKRNNYAAMLETEFKYFKKNHDTLYKSHPDKYLVIKGENVLFSEDTMEEALKRAIDSGLQVGSFLVQLCSEGDEAYTQTFHSRVIFA